MFNRGYSIVFRARAITTTTLLIVSLTLSAYSLANENGNAVLLIEAENASQSVGSGWSTENSLSGYTGTGYIVWRGANDFRTSDTEPPAGIKTYNFTVTEPGTYQFVARVQARVGNANAASDKDNDAWVKFTTGTATSDVRGDASKWTKFYTSGADESWKNYARGEQYGPTFFTQIQRDLPAGRHQILIGGRSARFAIDNVGLKLISSASNTSTIEDSVDAGISESIQTMPTMVVAVQPPAPQQAPASASGTCSASGENLASAKANYASSCNSIPRKDCDPLSNGAWLCSSTMIGSNVGIISLPQPSELQPSAISCSATGATLAKAKKSFARNCSAFKRRDCDPMQNGRWNCSSGLLGNNAPIQPLDIQATTAITVQQALPQATSVTATPVAAAPITAAPPPPQSTTVADSFTKISTSDLLALHYDNCPDRDDGHAIVSGKAVIDAIGLNNIIVVNGTCGADIRDRYQPSSVNVLQAVWGDNWLDSFNQQTATVAIAAERWASTLANGDEVWVAEGGPSDFTANVLRLIGERYPSVNRKNVRIVQHSAGSDGWNERNTAPAAISLVKRVADYIAIPDGNVRNNGSADLNRKSDAFVTVARQSRYANEWSVAFNYLDPNQKLDFSDTVELLFIVNDDQTQTVEDFANRYLR